MFRFIDWLNSGGISPVDIGVSVAYDKSNRSKEQTPTETESSDKVTNKKADKDADGK